MAASNGSSGCTKCSAGYKSSNTGSISCDACPVGRHQSSTGQASCDPCEEGKYMADEGQVSCTTCSEDASYGPAYTSPKGATSCNETTTLYYMNKGGAKACPAGADCSGTKVRCTWQEGQPIRKRPRIY